MKKRRIIAVIVIVLVFAIAATAVVMFWPKASNKGKVKIINKINAYGYTLEDDETALHKQYFNELVDVLEAKVIDEEAYASLVTKLFISDFYNLNNKPTKNDVGGIQYVFSTSQENMALKAKSTIYKYIESNIDNNRKQKLPIVSEVNVEDIEQVKYKYGKNTDDEAYKVTVKWTYKEDLNYQDEATITLIHEDNKLGIAELE